ncbi:hypothetical protein ACQCVH_15600 [Bacillus infantis]|uniref:hypothetical protein n=1 Tax=Bacillus infantis TaxID=324767 RepID=UPI003CE71558
MTDHFPKGEGKWKGKMKGYQVVKDTSAEKIVKENSLLLIKNHGKKTVSPAHGFLDEVGRQFLTGKGGGGEGAAIL